MHGGWKHERAGIPVVDEIEEYGDLGKFVHILDPEGNKIELWEQAIGNDANTDE
jgi:predicted enzyme related to lactoylglutathione lyase